MISEKDKNVSQAVKVTEIELEAIPEQRGFSSELIITESCSNEVPQEEDRKSE
jgi:hypothetical protein